MTEPATGPSLVQLHWQNRADFGQTEFIAQGGPFEDAADFQGWLSDLLERRKAECPEGWTPMVCTEGSPHFVLAPVRGPAASNE